MTDPWRQSKNALSLGEQHASSSTPAHSFPPGSVSKIVLFLLVVNKGVALQETSVYSIRIRKKKRE
jgi:hypothetical protein